MKKIFYDHGKWWAFEAPEKPRQWDYESGGDPPIMPAYVDPSYYDAMDKYEKAYAEAKANALEVGNINEVAGKVVFTKTFEAIGGINYFDWPGEAVIKDGKYILSI